MIALRKITDVKSGPLIIDLPHYFHARRVEIIILPIEEPSYLQPSLLDLLLEAPILMNDDLQEYERAREWMNEWHVKEF